MAGAVAGLLCFGLVYAKPPSKEKPVADTTNEVSAANQIKEVSEGQVARAKMVETQLMRRGLRDKRVLEVMGRVPRHLFIPAESRSMAYGDHPVGIGEGQTISQPYIVAYMTEALAPKPGQRVLEIGTGSGYQSAVLAELAGEVYTIEIVAPLARGARVLLDSLGYKNIRYRIGDGYQGWAEAAPFDAVILTAAPPKIPQPLLDQLKVGGVMIAPVGVGDQEMVRITKTTSGFTRERVMGVRFVPMTGRAMDER